MFGLKYFGSSWVLSFQFLEMCTILKQGSQLLQESQLCFKSPDCITRGKSNFEHGAASEPAFWAGIHFTLSWQWGLIRARPVWITSCLLNIFRFGSVCWSFISLRDCWYSFKALSLPWQGQQQFLQRSAFLFWNIWS